MRKAHKIDQKTGIIWIFNHLNLQIKALESNLSEIKSQLNQPEFDRVDAKAKRHAVKPYKVKLNNI